MYFMLRHLAVSGPGSSVGIATDYGLDGVGSYPVCFETWWSAVVFRQGVSRSNSYH